MELIKSDIQWLKSDKDFCFGYNFFKEWRKTNQKSPTHLVVYDCLISIGIEWGDLRSPKIENQPLFIYGEIDKLIEMDMTIIGIVVGQLFNEGKINQYFKEMAQNAISRQLNEAIYKDKRITKIRYIEWSETFARLHNLIENEKSIELANKNVEYFIKYFCEID